MISATFSAWEQLLGHLEVPPAQVRSLWAELTRHYGHRQRHYHNFDHLSDLLHQAAEQETAWQDYPLVQLAIWYHDLIYVPGSGENEALSAAVAAERLQAWLSPSQRASLLRWIEATKAHQLPAEQADADLARFLDSDLAILGQAPATYDAYAAAIRQEFRLIPKALYRPGRKKALERFLQRPFIYHTAAYRDRYESAARANLEREIGTLEGG